MKKAFITQSTTQDYINLIHTFYPSQAGRIEAAYDTKMEAHQVEKELRERQGCLDTYRPPNEVNLLKEIICSHLSRPFGITAGPSRLFGGTEIGSPYAEMYALETCPSEGPSFPLFTESTHSSNNCDFSNEDRRNPYQTEYGDNSNIGNYAHFNTGILQQQAAPVYQQQSQMQQPYQHHHQPLPQEAPFMAMHAQPRQQVLQPRAQRSYDPRPIQENYINRGLPYVHQECLETPRKEFCFLCSGRNHLGFNCPIYPGEIPINVQCPACQGFHRSACKGVHPATAKEIIGLPHNLNPSYGYEFVSNRPPRNNYDRGNNYGHRMGRGLRYHPYYNPNRGPRNFGHGTGGHRRFHEHYRSHGQQGHQIYPDQQQQQMTQNYQGQTQQVYQPQSQQHSHNLSTQQQTQIPIKQAPNVNLGHHATQHSKPSTLGNYRMPTTPEILHMNLMQANSQIQLQNQGQIELQNQQPQNMY